MKNSFYKSATTLLSAVVLTAALGLLSQPLTTRASGGGGGGGGSVQVDSIKVSKCYCNTGGQMLIKAASSDATATLTAYRPDGTVIGYVQNGGGSRYGGTVMPYQPYDPVNVTIKSSSGGSTTVPTTPFQL